MFDKLPGSAVDAIDWTFDQYKPYYDDLLARDLGADTVTHWLNDWSDITRLVEEVQSRLIVATTVDTTDEVAEERYNKFLDAVYPEVQRATNALNAKLVESGLEPAGFSVPLQKIRAAIEIFREENLPLLTEEHKLTMEYDKIIGAQTVEWEGKEVTLTQLSPLLQETDRAKRERVWRLSMARRLEDREKLNDFWSQFMAVRKQIANNADFVDYRAYQWKAMKRFDYTPEDCAAFHNAIEAVVVPAATRLYARRKERLGLDSLRPWDISVDAQNRPPLRPYQTSDELQNGLEAIFNQVDTALGSYFRTMRDADLLDMENRKGKAPGGYCIDYPQVRQPFIFMNAVGVHDDVQTLLHEGGHAFHVFETAHLPYIHQTDVPMEFAEVASMAMELIGGPYLASSAGGFYSEGDAKRARVEHLSDIIMFWPYMAVVDAFQHWVYTNHDTASDPTNCDAKWTELWDRFMPGIDFDGLEDIRATGWQRKIHIYEVPFYYIEYGLAQLGAVQIWANAMSDQGQAVRDYRSALALGGTETLPTLFETAGARFAFDTGTVGGAVQLVEMIIDQLDTP